MIKQMKQTMIKVMDIILEVINSPTPASWRSNRVKPSTVVHDPIRHCAMDHDGWGDVVDVHMGSVGLGELVEGGEVEETSFAVGVAMDPCFGVIETP